VLQPGGVGDSVTSPNLSPHEPGATGRCGDRPLVELIESARRAQYLFCEKFHRARRTIPPSSARCRRCHA